MQDSPPRIDSIATVLDRLGEASDGENVSIAEIVEAIGPGAFGPLLLVPALILVTPASGVPGMPTIGSLIVSLIAAQMVLGRRQLWLPGFVARRAIARKRLEQATGFLEHPARWVDRFARRRLAFLTERPWSIVPALVCAAMVLFAPAFETVPFSVTVYAAAVAVFALAFVAKDGLIVILGMALLVIGGAGLFMLVN